jgi:hypothetical protein
MISEKEQSPETLLHQVGARLTDSQLAALEERVAAERSTVAAVVRRAVVEYLADGPSFAVNQRGVGADP